MGQKKKQSVLLLTLAFKRCACCGEIKPTTEFAKKKHREKWGFYSYCNNCKQKKHKDYYRNNEEKCKLLARNRDLKKYGITLEDQERMLIEQGGKCKICGREILMFGESKHTTAHVDHDHSTGKVRGLLCQECNTGLGKFRDNTEYLANAIKYLKEYRNES